MNIPNEYFQQLDEFLESIHFDTDENEDMDIGEEEVDEGNEEELSKSKTPHIRIKSELQTWGDTEEDGKIYKTLLYIFFNTITKKVTFDPATHNNDAEIRKAKEILHEALTTRQFDLQRIPHEKDKNHVYSQQLISFKDNPELFMRNLHYIIAGSYYWVSTPEEVTV